MLSGAAPLPRHVEEFLRVTCSTISQGYGMSYELFWVQSMFMGYINTSDSLS